MGYIYLGVRLMKVVYSINYLVEIDDKKVYMKLWRGKFWFSWKVGDWNILVIF